MRLLSRCNGKLNVTDDLQTVTTPYAILSHTWSDEEVTFLDLEDAYDKAGYQKLDFCLEQAKRDGYDHVWVDTCCIDKRDKSELGEAINRMYEYYAGAAVCYVYLSDVTFASWRQSLVKSRWFTRGWTLQELVAPTEVKFYSCDRHFLGDRITLKDHIKEATQINTEVSIDQVSFPDRFKWSLDRQTTKLEDKSYCLLGLMEIKLVFNYGEGDSARERLLDEIELEHGRRTGRQLRQIELAWEQMQKQKELELQRQLELQKQMESQVHTSMHLAIDEDMMTLAELLDSLKFDDMGTRRNAISDPFSKTCTWLLTHPHYLEWTSMSRRILWIKGKPGAGKSTLVRFAEQACSSNHISFYFNARGGELERSGVGMYRSLLFQLLQTSPAVRGPVLEHIHKEAKQGNAWTLDLPNVQAAMRHAAAHLERPIQCFVDALDECALEEIQEMIYMFENNDQLYVCFASRYYPTLSIRQSLDILLEHQDDHFRDLKDYVTGRLDIDGPAGDRLKSQIVEKANGIFFWAILVVKLLNEELKDGNLYKVQDILDNLPGGVVEILQRIVKGDENYERFCVSLQWVLFAYRPLTAREFYFAILTSLAESGSIAASAYTSPADYDMLTDTFLEKFVWSASRGLAEVRSQRVQVIHESIRDYFLKYDGLTSLLDTQSTSDLEAWSHDRLKRCCTSYLTDCEGDDDIFPLLSYAGVYAIKHAEEAAKSIPQDHYLSHITHKNLRFLRSAINGFERGEPYSDMTTVQVLAISNTAELIKTAARCGYNINAGSSEAEIPSQYSVLHLAMLAPDSSWHDAAVAALLDSGAEIEGTGTNRTTGLQAAINRNNLAAVTLLLDRGANIETMTANGFTPLQSVVRRLFPDTDDIEMMELLLQKGAKIDARASDGRTAILMTANDTNKERVTKTLIAKGADVNARARDGISPLVQAVQTSNVDVVRMMLANGADGAQRTNALFVACEYGNFTLSEILVNAGAYVNSARDDAERETALFIAIRHGYLSVTSLLLEAEAEIEMRDSQGRTALMFACHWSRKDIVVKLLDAGADIEATDFSGQSVFTWARKDHSANWIMHDEAILDLLLVNCPGAVVEKENWQPPPLRYTGNAGQWLPSREKIRTIQWGPDDWTERGNVNKEIIGEPIIIRLPDDWTEKGNLSKEVVPGTGPVFVSPMSSSRQSTHGLAHMFARLKGWFGKNSGDA